MVRLVIFEYLLPAMRRKRLANALARCRRWRQSPNAPHWDRLCHLSECLLDTRRLITPPARQSSLPPRVPRAMVVSYEIHALHLEQALYFEIPRRKVEIVL